MKNTIYILISILLIINCKRHTIETQIHLKKSLSGGVKWDNPEKYKKDEDYQKAVEQAKNDFHTECKVGPNVSWVQVNQVGFQIVQGVMWWLKVELSDKNIYQMKIYQELEGTFELIECSK